MRIRGRVYHFLLTVAAVLVASALIGMWFSRKPLNEIEQCKDNLGMIFSALEVYAATHDGKYPRALGELCPSYLGQIPHCPAEDSDTYSASYVVGMLGGKGIISTRQVFTIYCTGQRHPGSPLNNPIIGPYRLELVGPHP